METDTPWVSLQDIAWPMGRAFAMGPFGSNIRSENYCSSGVPVVRGNNLKAERFSFKDFVYLSKDKANQLSSSFAFPGDVLFTAQGSVGQVGIIPLNSPHSVFVLSQNLMKVTIHREQADPLYVFYYFRSGAGQHEIMSHVNPTGVPCISQPLTSLRGFRLPLPPVHHQHAIARILGTLDDKIAVDRRTNETLESIARAIFKSWFVDFDPVRAKADGRLPAGMNAETAALFPARFHRTPLGSAPIGWLSTRWGEIATLEYGRSLRNYSNSTGPYRVYGTNGAIGWHTESLCGRAGIIIGRKGAYRGVHFSPNPFFVIDTAYYLKPKTYFNIVWAYYEISGLDINGMDSGSAIPSTSRDDFYQLPVILPAAEVLSAFGGIVSPLFAKMQANRAECVTLAELRDALLPKLLSGDLCIRDAEKMVEAHV
jgi:type I restriction enzyme S subunit